MPRGHYPGRLTLEQWMAHSIGQRRLQTDRAQSDLLGLWKSCGKKPCRRAHACQGDSKCRLRPYQADFNNPNLNRPDFKFSYQFPKRLSIPRAIIDQLPYLVEPSPPREIVEFCAAEAGAEAAAALRPIFGLHRRRRRTNRPRVASK